MIVVSKTFTTLETLTNAREAKAWMLEGLERNGAIDGSDASRIDEALKALEAEALKLNHPVVWLGVDLGDARVGLALSDPELTFAHPYGNIQAYGDSFRALDDVITVIEDEAVDHIVVGLPLQLDGTEGKSAKKARRWSANLEKRMRNLMDEHDFALYHIPQVTLLDERLTTVSAHRQLLEAQLGPAVIVRWSISNQLS